MWLFLFRQALYIFRELQLRLIVKALLRPTHLFCSPTYASRKRLRATIHSGWFRVYILSATLDNRAECAEKYMSRSKRSAVSDIFFQTSGSYGANTNALMRLSVPV